VLNAYEGERYARERLPQMIASQRALFRPRARALARALGRGGRVLEVGSFVGGFLREARKEGLECTGLDPSQQLVELCRREGLHVVRDTIEDFTARRPLPRYDAIAIWNTFDQLPDPRSALAAALRVLRSDGMILLRFPHGDCYRRLIAASPRPVRALAWNNLLGFPYLHGYGATSLDALAARFRLERTRLAGAVLGDAADASYARWARIEERIVKAAQRWQWRADLALAPWLEAELRLASSAP
jgi:SAM-dependent methyltransferase